ncbi:MAG: hypothetical protein ACKOE6_00700, partial [Flammeovirgaceae bacterium]
CVAHPWGRYVFFTVAALLWVSTSGFIFIEGEGLLFFSLGVWIQKTGFDVEKPSLSLSPKLWSIVFVTAAIIKTYLAFEGQQIVGDAVYPIITLLHKLTVVSGLIACWFGFNWLVTRLMQNKTWVWLSGFSFLIYTLHAPLVEILINPIFDLLDGIPAFRMIGFVGLPVVLIAFCVAVGALLRAAAPRLYGWLTGGRGLT